MAEVRPFDPQSQVTVKTVLTVGVTVLGMVTGVYGLYHGRFAVALVAIACLIAVALHHVVDLLLKHGFRRSLAVGTVIVLFLGLIVGVGLLIVPAAINQGKSLWSQAPSLLAKVQTTSFYRTVDRHFHLDHLIHSPEPQGGDVKGVVAGGLKAIGGAISAVVGAVTVLFLSIFMLVFGERVVGGILSEVLPPSRLRYQRVLRGMYHSLGGYVLGLGLICSINATLTTTFLAVSKTPGFLALGILSGFSSLIPYVGPTVAGSMITLLNLAVGGPIKGLITGIYFVLYGQLEGQLLGPVIFRRTVHVNPLVGLVSVVFFSELFGVIGAVVAVPLVAGGQILAREYLRLRREQRRNLTTAIALEEATVPPEPIEPSPDTSQAGPH